MIRWHNGRQATQLGKLVIRQQAMVGFRRGATQFDRLYFFWTISHGHELRRMLKFSFIAADSKGGSVSRPARD